MAGFAIYLPDTGELLRTGWCSDGDESLQAQPGEGLLLLPEDQDPQAITPETHLVVFSATGRAHVEPKAPIVASIDLTELTTDPSSHARIVGIPAGVEALVDNVSEGVIDDGTLVFGSDAPGTFTIELRRIDLLSKAFTITVTASDTDVIPLDTASAGASGANLGGLP
jgi:hypothetical protein